MDTSRGPLDVDESSSGDRDSFLMETFSMANIWGHLSWSFIVSDMWGSEI